MHNKTVPSRLRVKLQQTKPQPHAPSVRRDGSDRSLIVTVGNTDLPAFVSDGVLYIQAPLPHVFKAFAEDLSDFVRDMEIRVSSKGGAPFSLDCDGRPVYRAPVVKSSMVRSRREP